MKMLLDAIEMVEAVRVEDMDRLAAEDLAEAARVGVLLAEAQAHVRLLRKQVRRGHVRLVK
jgi:hypothetical protein